MRTIRTLFLLPAQLAATLAILALMPTNPGKTAAFLTLWGITFGRLIKPEVILVVSACLFFTLMNVATLQRGIFAFNHPDILGLPAYELFMWGFYLLHCKRFLNGPTPPFPSTAAWTLALLYAAAFAAIPDPNLLLLVTGTLLLTALYLFHEPLDLAYTGYMIFLGTAIEYIGVKSGQWHYPDPPAGGVPFWFITLWGGVGLFLRRLMLPLVNKFGRR